MQKNMPKLGAVLIAVMIAAWMGVLVTPAFAQKARVPQTGQTQCWDTTGTLIDCSGTGQDGDIRAGVPFPTPRFTDNRNGTVRDNLTRLIWLKNADCFGLVTWADALMAANTLTHGSCGLTDRSEAGDWRLPNVKEMQSLTDFGFFNPALSNAAGRAQWTEGDAFTGVQVPYWSSTTELSRPDGALTGFLLDGNWVIANKRIAQGRVWPVREGRERECDDEERESNQGGCR